QTGVQLGTPHYMAPEQARGERADARTDLYSVGVLLYELLTARPPFDAPTSWEVLQLQIDGRAPYVRAVMPDAPPSLDGVLQRALAKQPAKRFQSAQEMVEALEAVAAAAGGGVAAPPA